MLAIKLRRVGKRGQPSFRLVVSETRSKLQGKFVEDLGWYNPHTRAADIKGERVSYWVGNGAQPTEAVWKILRRFKVTQSKSDSDNTKVGNKSA